MAAYSSLLSLGNILDQLSQHPPRQRAVLDKAQIHSLLENISFLRDFLVDFPLIRADEIQGLEEKYARSAHAAEDVIESRLMDQTPQKSKDERRRSGIFGCFDFVVLCFKKMTLLRSSTLFSQDFSLLKGDKIQALEAKITRSTYAAEDIIESRVVDQILEDSEAGSESSSTLFCQDFSLLKGDKIQALETKITRSAYAAEDIIERRVVDQILEDSEAGSKSSSTLFCQDLQKVIEEFDSMKKDVMKIKETEGIKITEQPRKAATAGSFIRGAFDNKNTMVGFCEDLIQIMGRLTREDKSNLQIHSVVGIGGIGKTTLAKNVFDNPLIGLHFDLRAWVTISQQYSVNEILSGLLKDIKGEEITQKNDDELGLCLHRSLFHRRYFVVMDDMWSIEVWDSIKRFFPENNNGSRVMVTTRLSNVADNFQSCTPHQLHFLDEDQSWVLFCDKVFGKESCPLEFEEAGKIIARHCRGLPLAIVAISGLLAKSSRTIEYWEYVANDTYAALNMGGDELCFEILSLSYKHLPVHLKPCFLYMATFPEDSKIRISKLVKLWVAEGGILKPMRYRSLEEIAEVYLKDLIDRNLIQVHDYGSRNKIKTCTIHDLLRDLCLREAQKEKLFCVANRSRIIDNKHRLSSQRSSDEEEKLKDPFRVLRWLEQRCLDLHEVPCTEKIVLLNSRYIHFQALWFIWNFLGSLSFLWNLQTVTMDGSFRKVPINLPAGIWEMRQLRHLKMVGGDFHLPDPPSTSSKNGRRHNFVLKNLQTLYKTMNFRCTDEVVGRIPNLKKLGITYREFPSGIGWDYYEVYNLSHLRILESLFLESATEYGLPKNLCLPHSLKKLTLRNCGVCWEDLTVVGSLPHLEVLNLIDFAVKGREWNPVEGQFLQLKSLTIDYTDVEEWTADSSHFPRLEKLQLRFLRRLKQIPYGIGEIQTLLSISMVDCNDSVISSAKKIEEEQQNLGNYDFKVRVL